MNEKVILKPKVKEDNTTTFSIRIEKEIAQKYDELSNISNYSRNELISIALKYYIDVVEFVSDDTNNNDSTNKDSTKLPKKKKIPIKKT